MQHTAIEQVIPEAIVNSYQLQQCQVQFITHGHLNKTYKITKPDATHYILQTLNPIFKAEIHENIKAVTSHLKRRGLTTPELLPNREHALWTLDENGQVWRFMTHMDGKTILKADSNRICYSAGQMLGRFHTALLDLECDFQGTRLGVHDTPWHIEQLGKVLQAYNNHPLYQQLEPIAVDIFKRFELMDLAEELPERKVHGDPKVSNFLFSQNDQALCLVDLDTLNTMALPLELGDALRSFCNRLAEDSGTANFSREFFTAFMSGYASETKVWLTKDEWQAIPRFTERIALELAARFARDTLSENYFGWDKVRFQRSGEHQLLRAQGQLQLAREINKDLRKLDEELNSCR